jgi:hypothetical protein
MTSNTAKVTPANDNSTLWVVFNEGAKRNYLMRRVEQTTNPAPEGTVGMVDFGSKGKVTGLWIGIAELDEGTNKYIFKRMFQLERETDKLQA